MDRWRAAGALLALAACFATATAAPTSNHTALDLYDGPTEGCYYNFQHYGEGDRIMTNEPCLNCTCHNRMLMCYLRVCPFTKPIGQDCTVEKRADQCCPIVTCPDVPVDLLTSTSTTSPAEYGGTGVGKVDNYGCSINGKYFPEGAKVPPTPNKPCEHCYCIRNMTTCVMQECTLHVDGCTPIYHKDVCCPVRYFCDHPEDEPLQLDDMTTTVRPTPGFLLTTTTTEAPTTEIQTKRECTEDGEIYPDGALIKTEKPCVHCYCMKGDIVCVVQECGTPMENEGKNCTSMPPKEGQCCPDTYICEGDEITTKMSLEDTTTILPFEITTRRESVEGSGYRKEPGETYTEPSISFETEGSGDDKLLPTTSSDLLTPKEQITDDNLIENKFGVTDQILSSSTELPEFEVKEQTTTEPDKGLNTVPSEISEDEHSEPSVLEHTTIQEGIVPTISSTSLLQETPIISTSLKPDTTSTSEIIEKSTILPALQIEDESSQVTLKDKDEVTESITETGIETKSTTLYDQSKTTSSVNISEKTAEPTVTVPTTEKFDSVTEGKLSEITPEEVYDEMTSTDSIKQSSEPPLKEITTTVPNLMVTESTTISEEKEISSPVILEESTTQISEVTEPAEAQTTYKEIISEETSEPSLFEKTTSDEVTESKVNKTTSSTIYEDDISIVTTHKFVEEVIKSTEPTPIEEGKTTTNENLVEETDITSKPSYEQTPGQAIEYERKPTTEESSEHIHAEEISTFAPSTEVMPPEEKQGTTDATVLTTLQTGGKTQPAETTTLNPEDNEITEDILPPGRIPGEGDCLFDGITYRNESSVPNRNKCESSCKCISSIIKCDPIICSPPPEYMENCQLVYDTSESCCPTYICEETKETIPPQSHSQMSGTESPTSFPSLQCSDDECESSLEKQTTTVLPDSTKIPSSDDCDSEGCKGQVPDQTNVSGNQPEKCESDKCTNNCVDGNCQDPSLQVTPQHLPSDTIPQACQGSEECQEDKTDTPVCEGEGCISKTTTSPEILTPCKGDLCSLDSQNCTSDKCMTSDYAPMKPPQESEICTDEKDCKQIKEKDCQDDNCRRTEDHVEPAIQLLPSKCVGPDCPHDELSSPDQESTAAIPTTDQTLLETTLLPEPHSILESDTLPTELPNAATDSSREKTTSSPQITDDHINTEYLDTETPDKFETTLVPHITEGFEGENTVPHEDVTETEIHYTKQPVLSASEVYSDKDMITKPKETEKEVTTSLVMMENEELFTSSPVETETQREDMSSKAPESSFDETETDKPQVPLSDFEPKQPDQQEHFTKAPELEQPMETTDINNEQTEIPDQHLLSATTPKQEDIFELNTTTEHIEYTTTIPESTAGVRVKDKESSEKSEEQEITTVMPEFEKETTKVSLSDNIKHNTTQPDQFTSISTEASITQEQIKTDLPADLITEKDEIGTETPILPDTISYDTELPIETLEGDKESTDIPDIINKETASPSYEDITERIDSYPTTPESIITKTTLKPDEIITSEQDILEKESTTEMLTTESYVSLETKPSEEPYKTIDPEILRETTINPEDKITLNHETHMEEQHPEMPTTEISLPIDTKSSEEYDKSEKPELPTETPVLEISESTKPTTLQESTSEKESLTEKPTQIAPEINIPVSITEEPSEGTKETEESQICDSESECKKSQVSAAEKFPCQGESCVEDKKGCDSSDCSQSGLPPNATSTELCGKDSGCEKPSQEGSFECSKENCQIPETSIQKETPISNIEITSEIPSILEETLQAKISTIKPFITEIFTTEAPDFDKTTKEPLQEQENEVTQLPVSIITNIPIATESDKYDANEQDVTKAEESVTPMYEVTTIEPKKSETELPTYQDINQEKDVTVMAEEQFPTQYQGDVTETSVPTEVPAEEVELPQSTERGNDITELPKITRPDQNEMTVKPDIDVSQTLIPEQPQHKLPLPDSTTTKYNEVPSITEEEHKLKDEEMETKGPEMFVTTLGLSTSKPEVTVSQKTEDEMPETTEFEIVSSGVTDLPQITDKPTEQQKEYPETTPYLVELEEHPHEINEGITTLLPSEETNGQEPTDIHYTEKDQDFEISTQKSLQTETSQQDTEKPLDDILSSETIKTDAPPTTISEDNVEKSTEHYISEESSSELFKPPSTDQQMPDRTFTTETEDQENGISTVASTLPETNQTTQVPPETEKPQITIEENVPETTHDAFSSTAFTQKEEFIQVTTSKIDEEIATQSPSAVDKYNKPETSTDVYPSVQSTEMQKPVFGDIPPTDEVPQPEDESHFPPSGSYEPEPDYGEEDQFGPGTCRYGGKVYVSAQQIPRDDPCDFCFCFRSDIICLQQSCPPPIHGCREEPIQGFCCPRYECPVSMGTTLNVTTTTTTTTTTLPPHFLPHAYKGAAQRKGCQIKGHIYKVGEVVRASSGPCLHCTCGGDGQMKCDPKVCTPEPMLRQMIAAAVSAKRRR